MNCRRKRYEDGEYTLCSKCEKAETCQEAKRCFACGKFDGVAYESRWDVFCCEDCFKKLKARD